MQTVVNTDKLRSTASNLESIISNLSEKRNNLIRLQSNLDYSIRYARNINQTIMNLSSRLYEAQCDLNRIKTFLNTTANKYDTAEETINRAFNRMCELTGCDVNASNSNSIGAIKGNTEAKPKWYQTAGKFLVGAGVIVGTGAIAFFGSGVIATVAAGACIGATLGAGLSAIPALLSGESWDQIASEFMEGSITGSISGAIAAGFSNATIAIQAVASGAGDVITQGFSNLISGESFFKDSIKSFVTGATVGLASSALTDYLPKIASNKSKAIKQQLEKVNKYFISDDIHELMTDNLTKATKYVQSKSISYINPLLTNNSSKLVKFLNFDVSNKISDDLVYKVAGEFIKDTCKEFISTTEKAFFKISPLTMADDISKFVVNGAANFIFAD